VLDLINKYSHGFTFVPVVLACRKQGLFELLHQHECMTLQQLTDHMGANDGHLQVALRMMQSLKWISRNDHGEYSLTPKAEAQKEIPDDIQELFNLPIDSYLVGQQPEGILLGWIKRSSQRWDTSDPLIADFLDGILVIRVLIAINKNHLLEISEGERTLSFPRVSAVVREELHELFVSKGWGALEEGRLFLTDVGRFLIERILITGVTASYRPMFLRMPDLLFGDPREVIGRDAGGHEIHIDRSLNVVASGFQHDKYFTAVDDIILSIFDHPSYDEQPKYIADMGCGDGTLLKRVYEVIRSQSARGRVLQHHPVMVIGIDYNEEALQVAARTLADIPSLMLKGDIGDPERLIEDLKKHGIDDPENILHIRSFLDHDRPYLIPENVSRVQSRAVLPYKGVSVDTQGHVIPGHVMVQSLVEHLQRWSLVAGLHGLVIVEVHCLDPEIVYEFLDRSESLHFDAYHAFSMQHLVEAEIFLMAAAEAGLFPKPGFTRRFPQTLPFTRISINWFEKRPYTIRHPQLDDLVELVHLEEECLPEALRTTPEEIRRRIDRFPDGHCVLEFEGHIVGVIYSQRISGIEALRNSNTMNSHRLREAKGSAIQLLGISVLPQFQDKALGDQLLEFMLQWASLKGGIESVVGVTRCRNFSHHLAMPMEDYIMNRDERGQLLDPILRFHENHGARIIGCLPDYRPQDKENDGKGILIEYDIHDRQTVQDRPLKSPDTSGKLRDNEEKPSVRDIVEKCIRSLMGRRGRRNVLHFSPEHTLKEIGLDSLDLMELKSLLTQHFGTKLDSTFFFKYFTCDTITGYFENREWGNTTEVSGTRRVVTSPETNVAPDGSHLSTYRQHVHKTKQLPSRDQQSSSIQEKQASKDGAHASEFTESKAPSDNSVAIVGISCRFPHGANNTDDYWALLRDGIDAITEVPKTRWDVKYFQEFDRDNPWKPATRFGGFLDQVDQFDAQFFRIAPMEANYIDPQQRILLETTWEALENAGLNPHALKGTKTGIFVGIHTHDYEILQLKQSNVNDCSPYFATSNSPSVAAGRLSYFFDFQGPAVSVDTACSSSLVALHLACQSLLRGECDFAIAAGVNLLLSPELSVTYSKAGMLSQDGRCRTFDASANGYVRSEGCGVVVLKRFRNALSDNDNILAIVRGTAVNQDGSSNGLTAPNGFSQESVIRKALEIAGVSPSEISYVEAHGTGTTLGDPVEVKALETVYSKGRRKDQPLIIGSVKTNIGHTEAAAGIAGLIKVVLSLQNNCIPPHLHFKELNPHISLDLIPAIVPTVGVEWKKAVSGKARLAAVSSFGSSGTNSHVIVEEAPVSAPLPAVSEQIPQLFVLSAKSEEALRQLAQAYDVNLKYHPNVLLDDVCFTARTGRADFDHRLAIVTTSTKHLCEQLVAFGSGKGGDGLLSGTVSAQQNAKIAFLFTGQGSQYAGMGQELFETQPRFRETLKHCDEILRPYLEKPLLDVIYPQFNMGSPIDQTYYTQPALFALEYALADLWRSWGIEPSIVMGHSVGEYVAACVAGVFSLEDGLKLIAARGRLMQSLPTGGKMAAVFAGEQQVAACIGPYANEVSIGAINGPESVVISGAGRLVDKVAANLREQGFESIELTVSHAFHSPLMQPILSDFMSIAEDVHFSLPRVELISNVTGRLATDKIATPAYWRNHIRQPVRFADSMQTLHRQGYEIFLEVGPKPTLLGMGRRCLPDESTPGSESPLQWFPSLQPGVSDWQQLLQSLGSLYILGQVVDWQGLVGDYRPKKVALPTYPWQRTRYWIEPIEQIDRKVLPLSQPHSSDNKPYSLLGRRLSSPLSVYESQISTDSFADLDDHHTTRTNVFPLIAYLEMSLAAVTESFSTDCRILEDLTFHEAMVFSEHEVKVVQTILGEEKDGRVRCELFSRAGGNPTDENSSWQKHMTGKVRLKRPEVNASRATSTGVSEGDIRTRCNEEISGTVFYQRLRELGYQFRSERQAIDHIWKCDGEALAEIVLLKPDKTESEPLRMVPSSLAAGFQLLATVLTGSDGLTASTDVYLPVSLQMLKVAGFSGHRVWVHVAVRVGSDSGLVMPTVDFCFYNDEWQLIAEVRGLCVRIVNRQALLRAAQNSQAKRFYDITWLLKQRTSSNLQSCRPDFIPSPPQIANAVLPAFRRLTAQREWVRYEELSPQIDTLCVTYVLSAFAELGWKPHISEFVSTEGLLALMRVVSKHRRLTERMLEMLEEEGVLRRIGREWEVCLEPEAGNPDQLWSELLRNFPEFDAELGLLGRCGGQLAEVLRGNLEAIQLIFPEGSLDNAEKLYQESPIFSMWNRLVQLTFSHALEFLPEGHKIRILEIGAGTGSTTASVLPVLPADRTEYCFTDVSNLFLIGARNKLRQYPFVQYQLLDIEKDPELQGFTPHQFDIILAGNVLHATNDLQQTLEYVRKLLTTQGLVVLLELTNRIRWIDLIFGLTEGWWKFSDHELRPSYPLLSEKKWLDLLDKQGFSHCATISSSDIRYARSFPQAVLLACGSTLEGEVTVSPEICLPLGQLGIWLVLADHGGIGRMLAEKMQSHGLQCILVFPNEVHEKPAKGTIHINPSHHEDFEELFGQFNVPGRPPLAGVVYLWGLDVTGPDQTTHRTLETDLLRSCGGALHIVQSLMKVDTANHPYLWLVTRGAQPVYISGSLSLAQAPLWGLGRAIDLEQPAIWGGMVDLDPEDGLEASTVHLLNEILASEGEDQIVFRRGQRFVARLEESSNPSRKTESLTLRSDGVYLITGGLGGLGLKIARWMAEQGARHLVLLGRGGLPKYHKGKRSSFTSIGLQKLEDIQAIERLGTTVSVVSTDVSDWTKMRSLFAEFGKTKPPLRGIVHAASSVESIGLQDLDREALASAFRPKALGAWVLHQLTQEMELDFFVLFSSGSAVWGSKNLAHYAAANQFLDVLAHHRQSRGLPALSINWGWWAGGGATKGMESYFSQIGLIPMSDEGCLEALRDLLTTGAVQKTVSEFDWKIFGPVLEAKRHHPLLEKMLMRNETTYPGAGSGATDLKRRLADSAPDDRWNLLLEHVRVVTAQVLGFDKPDLLDQKKGFFSMGMDSIMTVQLKGRIEASLGQKLPRTIAFEYPSIEAFTNYLATEVLSLRPSCERTDQQPDEKTQATGTTEASELSEEELVGLLAEKLKGLQ
jgi:acyl transferase domain-containing protein/SAM-dependent methyltransferase/acyl carrier protein